ncbi:MAG: DUF262 domain-containing protein [Gammaproteobacteria bacterium]|nr:DUF262 domain-containing protein [Gammaproteobacteria bacterium]
MVGNQFLDQILANSSHCAVPTFHRAYSWGVEEWDTLWEDLLDLCNDRNDQGDPSGHDVTEHYLGFLVLKDCGRQATGAMEYEIIDGQNRITTLSIVILSCLASVQDSINSGHARNGSSELLKGIRDSYIGTLDLVCHDHPTKLTLNGDADHYYQEYLAKLRPSQKHPLNEAESLLKESFDWFKEKASQRFNENSTGAESLFQFIRIITNKLFFTVITTTSDIDAYTIFDRLAGCNAHQCANDLLKNHLLKLIEKSAIEHPKLTELNDKWQQAIYNLPGNQFAELLRHHWQSRHKKVKKNNLCQEICIEITDSKSATALIEDLWQASRSTLS